MKKRMVAFLDILGCSNTEINGTICEKNKLHTLINLINKTYSSKLEIKRVGPPGGQSIVFFPELLSVSDSIVVSIKISDPSEFYEQRTIESFISTIISIYWAGLHHGFLIRGGITMGDCHHDSNLIYGEAYVRAVKLEKETKYPRIEFDKAIFDESLPDIFINEQMKSICIKEFEDRLLLNCLGWHSGVWSDYFHLKYNQHNWPEDQKTVIVKAIEDIESITALQLSKTKDGALEKWTWFKDQWNQEKRHWPIFN